MVKNQPERDLNSMLQPLRTNIDRRVLYWAELDMIESAFHASPKRQKCILDALFQVELEKSVDFNLPELTTDIKLINEKLLMKERNI